MNKEYTVRPAGYRLLIKKLDVEEKTESGIITMTADQKKRDEGGQNKGIIVAMGPVAFKGYRGAIDLKGSEDWGCKIGDIIEFRRYDGQAPQLEGYEDYFYINDEDVVAVHDKKDESAGGAPIDFGGGPQVQAAGTIHVKKVEIKK